MTKFAVCFLMVFGELAFGGALALAIPPFFKVERGFYKSSAAVYLAAAMLTAVGFALLAIRGTPEGPSASSLWIACGLWVFFCLAIGIYMVTLWTEAGILRARAYTAALASGLIAVIANVTLLKPAEFGFAGSILYGLTAVASSLVLGLTSGGMLFGHWYLIDPSLPVDYLRSFVRLLGLALVADIAALALATGLLALLGGPGGADAVRSLFGSHSELLAIRVLIGPIATLALAWMCWQTLKFPQTMAATGLLYIAVMSALVGEILGRFILFRTAVPL
ncbi:MAG TPA: hypothetical protein VIX12_00550 [Candidatus Binataceae bacterium]